MRLDPVYLVAPEPPKPSRRAFFAFGLGGLLLGGGVGYLAGRGVGGVDDPRSLGGPDPRIEWAVGLAQGPIEDLERHYVAFVATIWEYPSGPKELWQGFERLVIRVLEGRGLSGAERRRVAEYLLQTLERGEHPSQLERFTRGLQQIVR